MFLLRLFGAPLVAGPEGPLAGRIAQRHPLALLALLATAPSATVSREKLLGVLWPDSDTDGARDLLNAAIHHVRKALGDAAVRSVGSSLQLDEAIVRSDVRAFAEALYAGEPARAVEAYAGPFLDGFFLDAEEFDRWVEAERARLAGLYAEALETLAGAAEAAGGPVQAAGWWKRRAAHDPLDSRVAMRLMEAMAAAGDRAGALRHAAVHAALLQDRLGAAADPAVEALAERIRTAPPPPAVAAPAEAVGAARAQAGEPVSSAPGAEAGESAGGPPRAAMPAAPAPIAPTRRAPGRRSTVLALCAAAVLVPAVGALALRGRGESEPSVAVLPFQPLRDAAGGPEDNARDDYVRLGLADEVINSLAKSSGVRVIARGSSFSFDGRDADVNEVGRALDVTHVLEGLVRRHGGRLRVSAHLVRVADRRIVWSDAYDEDDEEVFSVQEQIASSVAAELHGRRRAFPSAPTDDPVAYDLYLQGRNAWYRRRPDGLQDAAARFRQALARDPRFVPAWVGLANAYNVMGGVEYGLMPAEEAFRGAAAAARRALQLDPRSAEAHAALANALVNHAESWPEAEAHFRRAIELNPGSADTYHWYSQGLLAAGRRDEAQDAIRRAQRLDPFSAVATAELARNQYYQRRYAAAAEEYRRAAEIDPRLASPHLGLGQVYEQTGAPAAAAREYAVADSLLGGGYPLSLALLAHAEARQGRRDRARALLSRLEAMSREGRYIPPEYLAIVHLGLGEHDRAITLLERAYAANPGLRVPLRLEPLVDPIRRDPRFIRLVGSDGP